MTQPSPEAYQGFQVAVSAIRSWAAGFSDEMTQRRLRAVAQDLEDNRSEILGTAREMSPEDIERVARAIADGLGDDFDDAHESKSDWITQRGDGLVTGRFRDVNEPRKPDYLEAARAALQAIKGASS